MAVEDSPDGDGHRVGEQSIHAGETRDLFAVARSSDGAFVANIPSSWSITSNIGTVEVGPDSKTTFRATSQGVGRVRATTSTSFAETGDLTVNAGTPVALAIFDGPGGHGSLVGDRSLTADESLELVAASIDEFGNWTQDVDATWTVTGGIGVVTVGATVSALFEANTPGDGRVEAVHAELGPASTGTLSVVAGRAASLAIEPDSLTLSADDAPFAFVVSAWDADDNSTSDVGLLTWEVSTGPITAIDADSGIFDPTGAGTGTLSVSSSYGSTDESGAIKVTPGVAASFNVEPDTVSAIAGDSAVLFDVVDVQDADANPTTDVGTLAWTVSSGPIGSLDPSTGALTPTVAGLGTVRATSSHGAFDDSGPIDIQAGAAVALTISPDTLTIAQGAAPVPFSVTGVDAFGNMTTSVGTLTWSIASGPIATIDPASGIFNPTVPGTGTIRTVSSLGPTDVTGLIEVTQGATLVATLTAPSTRNEAQSFDVVMTVSNLGAAPAVEVKPSALTQAGTTTALLKSGPSPATATIPPGGFATFALNYVAGVAGTVQFTGSASGLDGATSASIVSPDAASQVLTVQVPAALEASISVPSSPVLGASFPVTVQVKNVGEATAVNVSPDGLTLSGTALAALSSGPVPPTASLTSGQSVDFVLTYQATGEGTGLFKGTASGQDGNTVAIITSAEVASPPFDVVGEGVILELDPLGDGTSFAFVFGHAGHVYVGPRASGTGAVRFDPNGGNHEDVDFRFPADGVGNKSRNGSTPPYTSIGSTGCTSDTQSCGPDNEDGRGLFASGLVSGVEWVVAGGARSGGDLDYVYMSTDATTTMQYRFVDLSQALGGGTRGFSAMHVLLDRIYLGFPDEGGSRPYFISLITTPPSPGLDAVKDVDYFDLQGDKLPGFDVGNPVMVDAIGSFHDRIYLGNANRWFRSINATPQTDVEFVDCTPSAPAYAMHTSIHTLKTANIEPIDRALSGFAVFQGRLFASRNTVNGPQLWGCDPGVDLQCAPGEWSLIAANTTGTTTLTQFDNPNNIIISLLAATSSHLYVGFDNKIDGAVVFRAAVAPTSQADFEGTSGCSAALHPGSCEGLLGNGLGDPTRRARFFDGKALDFGAINDVYAVVGNGSGPVDVVRLID